MTVNKSQQINGKYQHKLITLISTLEYVNKNKKKYNQSDILYCFNSNLRRNGQKEVSIKTLRNYFYKLEKLNITINYHRHLGINMGTEIYYALRYSKKNCYNLLNQYFRNKKTERFQKRVNSYIKINYNKKDNVTHGECYNNKNIIEEKERKIKIDEFKLKKYAKKCNFSQNISSFIINLNLKREITIKLFKLISKEKYCFKKENKIDLQKTLQNKRKDLILTLKKTQKSLMNEGYNKEKLKIHIQNVYKKYKDKPHFILEINKYKDLNQIINKIRNNIEKFDIQKHKNNIKNNIYNILIDQLNHKINKINLSSKIKEYLNKQKKLEYKKIFNNQYYNEIIEIIKSQNNNEEKIPVQIKSLK
ncbi:plasmid maintenance protein [Borreliella americana]|uniref:plasmid maintenance protein n=1 Tax=Borreliella americana TaxID=478807 RepID=UPI001E33702E|nr:plasmid maintenance protein [Borreliella americana]MCD2332724.1 plasmid maintenance protein [Borreliella americana]MCD2382026.1 plasmid maintenance protein [Borreliella americana]